MIVLVSNIGSTSFKFKLFDFAAGERVLAEGGCDRIGLGKSNWKLTAGETKAGGTADLMDHGQAIELHLKHLVDLGAIDSIDAVKAIGFKAVHGGPISGAVAVDDHVIATMEQFADIAPQHNPPYIAAMRAFKGKLPGVPQVAAFETGFHQSIPLARQVYGTPYEWIEKLGIRRFGFHGASHGYIAMRMGQIDPAAKRIISCHLGGSCSICAIEDGRSVANSFGMTAQSGVFHGARVGDFDTFALRRLIKGGMSLDDIFDELGNRAGLAGLSGVSSDMRDVEDAAANGNERARLAVDAFIESIRHYVGAYLVALGGADALVFTGGIGQYGQAIRRAVCDNLDFVGIALDDQKNDTAPGGDETRIDAGGKVQVWVLPTNEELIVARQTVAVLDKQGSRAKSLGPREEKIGIAKN
jgi:acetate kinase